jgi:hypothetical protein
MVVVMDVKYLVKFAGLGLLALVLFGFLLLALSIK